MRYRFCEPSSVAVNCLRPPATNKHFERKHIMCEIALSISPNNALQ
ncbi:hypothetical protein ARMA_0532 [Ardenticatena maritima]|uniref:Uncharacterized protein n=1 Tax=Ardenticatena maritima TaxID=872965 RepID=A0A0M8K7K5_9CHLR|nr:hypothetical protein ARMA_0532 [Ardenticatena maritima]